MSQKTLPTSNGIKKIVFAGGTHCGKTTLVEYFASMGYDTVSESGIAVINAIIEEKGWEGYRTWRFQHQAEFVEKMLDAQIAFEKSVSSDASYVFFDRGIIDYFAMAEHLEVSIPERFTTYTRESRYNTIFLCEPLSHFDPREETGRTFTREDSKKLTERADTLYRSYGYEPIRLPDMPVVERIHMVKETLSLD